MNVEQAGQKNRNGKMIVVLFCNVFYKCIEGKSGICLLLMMFIGDDWIGWLIWWLSISKRPLAKLCILMTLSNSTTYWNLKIKYMLDISIAPPLFTKTSWFTLKEELSRCHEWIGIVVARCDRIGLFEYCTVQDQLHSAWKGIIVDSVEVFCS